MSDLPTICAGAWRRSDLPRGSVVAIGNFDGVHLGQQETLLQVATRADLLGVAAGVVTFEPHPLAVIAPQRTPPRITTSNQKFTLLAANGIEQIYVIDFDDDFSRVSAEEFVRHFLVEGIAAREVYVGSSFEFGNGRGGNLALLSELGERLGFRAVGVNEVESGGEAISSTRIRRDLLEGRVAEARVLLGRAHSIEGNVSHGQGRGRGLGWPTINIEGCDQMLPASGVYTTTVHFATDGVERPSVTNVGRRPTFDPSRERVVESHILDFDADTYGLLAEVRFLERLRDELTFDGPASLTAQISLDVEAAREYFRDASC